MDNSNEVKKILANLNQAQQEAVKTIDGPVMVLAGPGSGKTQLLTSRVAYILLTTDLSSENILCLTFTDSAVVTMRNRLVKIIGQEAYKVKIMTFHAFCYEIIQNNSYYFEKLSLYQIADQLKSLDIVQKILNDLDYNYKLKNISSYNILDLIQALKNGLITTDELTTMVDQELSFVSLVNQKIKIFNDQITRIQKSSVDIFKQFETIINDIPLEFSINQENIKSLILQDLKQAIEDYHQTNKTNSLTKFKKNWLERNSDNIFCLKSKIEYSNIKEIINIFKKYQQQLDDNSLLDYADIINTVIEKLQSNKELLYSVQEQFQYILVDEFQDTNEAQYQIVELLADNPVNNHQPNILIVGDDDQAIFSFQGANYSHMIKFYKNYKNVKLINLDLNYRSAKPIIDLASQLALTIDGRVTKFLNKVEKKLTPTVNGQGLIDRQVFFRSDDQYDYIGALCQKLIKQDKIKPQEIAIIAPKHALLKKIIPYLKKYDLSLNYEKRDNILNDPLINNLIVGCKLIQELSFEGHIYQADSLWSEFLSADFFQIPAEKLWSLSFQAYDQRLNWTNLLLEDDQLKPIAQFILNLVKNIKLYSIEEILDFLIGQSEEPLSHYRSPFYDYYFDQADKLNYYSLLLSNLIQLRSNLREYSKLSNQTIFLSDFLSYIELLKANDYDIINNDQHLDNQDSITLSSIHQAKGQEFEVVILIDLDEDNWVKTTDKKIKIPKTINFVYYKDSIDEKKRSLYVALTRAKSQLYLFSINHKKPLSLMEEVEEDQALISPFISPNHIPFNNYQAKKLTIKDINYSWHQRHLDSLNEENNRIRLIERLKKYQLSPTNLNDFLNLEYTGPKKFFINTILRMPKATSDNLGYGNAIHSSLELLSLSLMNNKQPISQLELIKKFHQLLKKQTINQQNFDRLIKRGEKTLSIFYQDYLPTMPKNQLVELSFKNEGIFNQQAHLTGKIDRIDLDEKNKSIHLIDYKTSKPDSLSSKPDYRRQLYFYIYLLKNLKKFRDWDIQASIIFVEPDINDQLQQKDLKFDEQDYFKVIKLMPIVWKKIMNLDFPDTSKFESNSTGTKKFEQELIDKELEKTI